MTFARPLCEQLAAVPSVCGGIDSRRNIDAALPRPSPRGGWPRPSFRWQLWQARALNSGPRPSDDFVDDGADTHSLRKIRVADLEVELASRSPYWPKNVRMRPARSVLATRGRRAARRSSSGARRREACRHRVERAAAPTGGQLAPAGSAQRRRRRAKAGASASAGRGGVEPCTVGHAATGAAQPSQALLLPEHGCPGRRGCRNLRTRSASGRAPRRRARTLGSGRSAPSIAACDHGVALRVALADHLVVRLDRLRARLTSAVIASMVAVERLAHAIVDVRTTSPSRDRTRWPPYRPCRRCAYSGRDRRSRCRRTS